MKHFFAGITAALLAVLSSAYPAYANDLACSLSEDADQSQVMCDVRLSSPAKVATYGMRANETALTDVAFQSLEEQGKTSAWLFLIDRSNPGRSASVRQQVELVESMLNQARANQAMGVASFANTVDVVIPISDRIYNAGAQLDTIRADGAATEFFASAIEAIEILKAYPADRRALVILSDGKAEDKAYSREDVVKAAKDAGVIIYGLGFADRATETPFLQVLRRLAEDTGGPFESAVGNADIPPSFRNSFTDFLTSGGTLTAALGNVTGDLEIAVDLVLSNGEKVALSQNLTRDYSPPAPEPEPEPQPEPELSLIGKIYSVLDPVVAGAGKWADANQPLAILGLLLPILLLAVVVFLLVRGMKPQAAGPFMPEVAAQPTNATQMDIVSDESTVVYTSPITEPSKPVFGYFIFLDDQSQKFPIQTKSLKIGRHSDNDFRLNNDSVHRHHAHFRYDGNNKPIITDLNTVNGVFVNGQKVQSADLKSGDMIELGEVRFRFNDA